MSPRPGERASGRAAERGAGKAGAELPDRGLPAGPPAAPFAPHFERLPTSRRLGRPRSAPRACPRPAGARRGRRELAGREEEEEGGGGGSRGWRGGGSAPRRPPAPSPPPPPAWLRCPDAPPTRGPLLPPQPPQPPSSDWPPVPADLSSGRVLGVRLCFLIFIAFNPLFESKWGWAVEMGPGGAQVCAPVSGTVESREQRRAGDSRLSGPWELLNGRFPRCLLPPFPPCRSLFSLQPLRFFRLLFPLLT